MRFVERDRCVRLMQIHRVFCLIKAERMDNGEGGGRGRGPGLDSRASFESFRLLGILDEMEEWRGGEGCIVYYYCPMLVMLDGTFRGDL